MKHVIELPLVILYVIRWSNSDGLSKWDRRSCNVDQTLSESKNGKSVQLKMMKNIR